MALLPSCLRCASRSLSTSAAAFRLRDKFLWESDMDKRPSELEIKKKKLPPNTPTLGMIYRIIEISKEHFLTHSSLRFMLDKPASTNWRACLDGCHFLFIFRPPSLTAVKQNAKSEVPHNSK